MRTKTQGRPGFAVFPLANGFRPSLGLLAADMKRAARLMMLDTGHLSKVPPLSGTASQR